MNDFVRYHLNAAVAFSVSLPFPSHFTVVESAVVNNNCNQMAIPLGEAPDPAYTRVINDMSVVLADVLLAGYAYYAVIRGRGPGLYRGTWYVQPLYTRISLSSLSQA